MKGVPSTLRLRLLKSDPTPSLAKMTEFVHHFYATRCDGTNDLAAVCSSGESNEPPHASLLHIVNQLTAAVAYLTTHQAQLKAAMDEQHQQQLPSMPSHEVPSMPSKMAETTASIGPLDTIALFQPQSTWPFC